ncbi:hypothetical protein [Brevibacillus brevis]|uniref:Uncharacterized protein n=1 Tax=Brevibacillus brevis TaxID=1393 RepID=A0A517I0T1_BREBE|nr:hypothetical protein [Brevibacillus brevis]QDS32501.1 hypothetical protein FPS98_00060 [Brevibacillus brevis]
MNESMKNYVYSEMPVRKIQTALVSIRMGRYVGTIQYRISDLATGSYILQDAIDYVTNWKFDASEIKVGSVIENGEGVVKSLILNHEESGEPFKIDFPDGNGVLRNHIVGVQITDWKEDENKY